jgi:hypothetical protein
VDTVAAYEVDVVGGEDAGFGDGDAGAPGHSFTLTPTLSPRGRGRGRSDFGQQVERGLQAYLEGAQVVVVDALQRVGEIDI